MRGCLSGAISVAGSAAAKEVSQRVGVVVGGLAQWVVSCGDHAKPSCGSGAERRAVLLCG